MHRWLLLAIALVCAGCHTSTIPDPNDPADKTISPEILRKNLKAVSDALIERRLRNEFDNEGYKNLLAQGASDLVKELDLQHVAPEEAWQFGEVLRAARHWDTAKQMLVIAVKYAKMTKSEDRRVNDTLRLAQVECQLGQVQQGIETAKEVLNAKPSDSAPILLAVLYEITPAARGKDHDLELADLLEAAIHKHIRTAVDPDSEPGRDFMAARQTHIRNAYQVLSQLYASGGEKQKSEQAAAMARQVDEDFNGYLSQELQKGVAPVPPAEGQSRL